MSSADSSVLNYLAKEEKYIDTRGVDRNREIVELRVGHLGQDLLFGWIAE